MTKHFKDLKKSVTLVLKKSDHARVVGFALIIGVAVSASYYGLRYRAISRAEGFISKGFGALAVEAVDPFRHGLTASERGCRILVNSYFMAKKLDRLEWTAQACLNSDTFVGEVYVGLAATRELSGNDPEAIQILLQGLEKLQKSPEIHYRLATILRRNKKDKEAVGEYTKASEYLPKNFQLALEALQYASSLQSWGEAKVFAERLLPAPTDNAELKLMVARALLRAGDHNSAKMAVDQAQVLMSKSPEIKVALEKAYADVLQPKENTPVRTPSNSK